jgi:hypothetical protein
MPGPGSDPGYPISKKISVDSKVGMTKISDNDQDRAKGATESDERNHDQNAGLASQLGHRDQDPILKDADSDFPEPGNNPEHSTGRSPAARKKDEPKIA